MEPRARTKLDRTWLVHLLVAVAVVVSLGLPFIAVSFDAVTPSGRVEFEDSASFLGRGTGRAGGDQERVPGTSVTSGEAARLAESITDPLDLTIVVHAAAILVVLGLIRSPRGATLGLVGGLAGLSTTVILWFLMSQRASTVESAVGSGLGVDFGPGTILAPIAFGTSVAWSAARLTSRRDADESLPSPAGREFAPEGEAVARAPTVVRGVGWYLVAMAVLGLLVLTSPTARTQLAWRLPLLALTAAAGIGLVLERRWAFVLALLLGGLNLPFAVAIVVHAATHPVRLGPFFLPSLLMSALALLPFILLLREEPRTWYRETRTGSLARRVQRL